MNSKHRALALAALFALTFGIGVTQMSANNSLNDLGYNCALPDATIAWYNGATGEYADIYQGEAISDGDSWNNYTVLDLGQVGSPGADDQVNSYNGYYGFTPWAGIADPQPSDSCVYGSAQVVYWDTHLNQTYLDDGSYSSTNKRHIACQELGHAFSVAHGSAPDSCMRTTGALDAPQPNAHDAQVLGCTYNPGGSDTLLHDQWLAPDQSVSAVGGWYTLLYQLDGNLVLYRWDGVPVWASNTAGTTPGVAYMQSDGNFVIYDANGTSVWASNTSGKPAVTSRCPVRGCRDHQRRVRGALEATVGQGTAVLR